MYDRIEHKERSPGNMIINLNLRCLTVIFIFINVFYLR